MYSITVIEDDGLLSKYLYHECTDAGFKCRFAFNGIAGLEEVRANPPNLVLLDIIMPGKSGLEVLEEMRKDPHTQTIPVIIMSVSGTDDIIKRALQLGAVDYIIKSQHTAGEIVESAKEFILKGSVAPVHV